MAVLNEYMQCLLGGTDGKSRQIAFLPVSLAVAGKVVEVEDRSWNVLQVWRVVVNEDELNSYRKAWKQLDKVLK